jgi:hypothetical protein
MVNMKLDWIKKLGLVFLITLLFNGCKSVDEETDCVYHLNQKDYNTVADDSSCSTYERASAELGLAGFLFSNFLVGDAADNFRQALGIPNSASTWDAWAGKPHYENAMQLSGDSAGDSYDGLTRPQEDAEIHYFATVGALLAMTYIEMDANADGDVSETEIQTFTNIRESTDPAYGKNDISPAEWIEFDTGAQVYLLNMTSGECVQQGVPEYDGLWDGTIEDIYSPTPCGVIPVPTAPEIAQWVVDGYGSINITGECAVVVKVEEIQNLFLAASGSSMSVADLTQNFVIYVNAIDHDMQELGIAEDSDLRKGLADFSENIDNGGTCENDTLTEVDQIFSILDVAEENDQGVADYENVNVLSFADISAASDTAVAVPGLTAVVEESGVPVTVTFTCSNAASLSARLIYKSGATYVPYYSGADAGIATTFANLKDLNTDASSNPKPNIASDEIISFKELLCME